MDATGFAAILTAIAVLGTAVWKVFLDVHRLRKAAAKLEGKWDAFWVATLERAKIEAVTRGCIVIVDTGEHWVTNKARPHFEPIKQDLRDCYRELIRQRGRCPDDTDLAWAILHSKVERWIVENVCPKLELNNFGCLIVASAIARESEI